MISRVPAETEGRSVIACSLTAWTASGRSPSSIRETRRPIADSARVARNGLMLPPTAHTWKLVRRKAPLILALVLSQMLLAHTEGGGAVSLLDLTRR